MHIKTLNEYSSRQDFINSIKSFNDIDEDKIREIFDYFGTEGYNDEEDAFDDFKDKIKEWKKFSNPQLLYRIVGVKNKKLIDTNNLGEHWTQYKWNLDGDMLMSIGYENLDDDDTKPFVIEALVPLSEIDIVQTIIQNLSFPNEHEINLKNKGKNVKFVKSYKLKGF
ncbi:hypothetical protein M0Q97_10615 [Candidatus Dojkabacteria bacterium]|jgi:hypothetical protein|nr:hypothetical protein [Candidatus Dojkabacteria bacterium]